MGKWSRKFGNILTAAGISLIVAAGALAMPIEASAARTVTDDVMIRNDASTEAGIIGSLNEGDEVTILDVTQSADGYAWYYIQLENGATGFVRSDLIEADDSELAGFSQEVQNEPQTQQEEPEAEPDQEPEQESETSSQEQEAVSEEAADVTVQTDAEGYDATKDPNANFRTGYETEADGTVTWYVYNDDNGSKVRISDLQGQQAAPAAGSEGPGIWRPLAIIFGILTIGLAAFALFLIKSIQEGRSKTTRGRALEAAAAMEDEDEEEDEFIFEDDEDDAEEEEPAADSEKADADEEQEETDSETAPEADKAMPDSTITMDVPDESEPVVIGEEQIEAIVEEDTAGSQDGTAAEETEEVLEATEPEQDKETEQEEPQPDAEFEEEDAQESLSTMPEEEVFEEEENLEEDEEEVFDEDEDYDSEDEDEDYDSEDEDEDYDSQDEDYDSEDEEEEEYDEDEEEPRTGAKASSKGGFFGFLKKIFGTETKEDHEDEEEYEDYDEDEPEEHEFDEFKEYPEDIDLLPREDRDDEESFDDEEEYYEQEDPAEDTSRSRLSMDRVMKNVSYKEEEADFSGDDDPNDLMDSLFEDDDDMEYSFITSTRRK